MIKIFLLLQIMQSQRLLSKVGDSHRFQLYSIVFVCLKWMIVSLTVFLPSYLFITPTFTCNNITNVLETEACPIINQCSIEQIHTITAYAGLYCDQKFIRNSIISSEFVGSITGLILLSILADTLGRKKIIVSALYICLIGSMIVIIGTHYLIYPLLYAGMIMLGFGGYSLSMVSYSYLSQINSDMWRQKSLILTYSFWAIGQILLYPIITYIYYWRNICIFIFVIPFGVLTIMSYFIVQPPQFLLAKKRYDECLASLNAIARFNGLPVLKKIDASDYEEPTEEPERLQDTFFKFKYLLPLVVLSFAQICNNGFYYTIQYSVDQYGYRFEVNMLVIGILQLISCLFTNHFCHLMKRKFWIIVFMTLSGCFGLLVQLTGSSETLDLIFIGASRLFNTVGFALFSLISAETFPTTIRSTGLGITQAMSNVGNMGAPFIVILAQEIGVKSVFVGGLLNLAGACSMLAVKQTKKSEQKINKEEPQTVSLLSDGNGQ